MYILQCMLKGLLAGVVSAYTFAFIHGVFISNIWFSLPVLLAAGAISGFWLGWTYALLFPVPSIQTWLKYNALLVGMFVFLGLASVLVYEPVTTLGVLMTLGEPPDFLFRQALPVTILVTLSMTAVLALLFARRWTQIPVILLTCTVLAALLGLNVSVIGLIEIPTSSLYLTVELAGLILALNLVFAAIYLLLDWKRFFTGRAATAAAGR